MGHLIEKGIDIVYTPNGEFASTWHSLENCIGEPIATDGSNVKGAFVNMVESKFTLDGIDPSRLYNGKLGDSDETSEFDNPLDGWKMILAEHDKGLIPIHVPKSGYVIHQNKALFDSFIKACEAVLGAGNFEIATIGTLGACSQFFVSISIKGMESFTVGKSDVQRKFFNLISSHNGIISSAIMLSIIRMVCMNTVMASLADAEANGRQSKFKHTAKSLELITPQSFETSLRAWVQAAESYQKALEYFTTVPMTVDGFRAFATGVFTNEKSDDISATSFNRVSDMVPLFQRGKGNVGVTLADGVNAFTEYFTSGNGVGRNVTAAKRVAMANFGRGNDWKRQAIAIASNQDDFASVCERGERLFAEYVKVQATKN